MVGDMRLKVINFANKTICNTKPMQRIIILLTAIMFMISAKAKTLIVYYSYTNNVHAIVTELRDRIEADVIRIEPAEKGLDYAADNYAIGSAQIAAIRANPGDATSYPPIDPVDVDLDLYDTFIIAAPLWWSNMAAPMQTFLFHHGNEMAGKHVGLIVSSASSGISGVEGDAHRLVPDGDFLSPSLWIRSSQTSMAGTMIDDWLETINYDSLTSSYQKILADRKVTYSIYSLTGNCLGRDVESISALDNGIYIVNGTKLRINK